MAHYTRSELIDLGIKFIGENCLISKKASFYNLKNIEIGNNVRIDDFCILSAGKGGIKLKNYIHIAAYTSLIGEAQIYLDDFTNISSRVSIYSNNDDYSGEYMTSPMIPSKYTNIEKLPVYISKHTIVGTGSVILPGSKLKCGVAIGALSLVKGDCEEFTIYAGNPLKKIKQRSKKLQHFERLFYESK